MTALPRFLRPKTPQPRRNASGDLSLPVLQSVAATGLPSSPDAPAAKRGASRGIRRSKAGPRRAVVLILVHVAFLVHVLVWLRVGRTVSPVEPSESMKTIITGAINAGFVFFAVAILSTVVFGRFFCGWGCHVVALQDLCSWMLKKVGVRPKPFRSRLLVFAPLVFAFYMFLWPIAHRFVVFPLVQRHGSPQAQAFFGGVPPFGWSTEFIVEDFWATFPPLWVAIPFLFICGFVIVYFLGAKGFCTYACPYAGFFAPADTVSPGRIVVDHDKCEGCGHCTAVCTSNVRVHEEIRDFGMVVDPGCMKCLDCVSVCPNDALSFGFARPPVAKGKPGHRLRYFQKKGARSKDPRGAQVGTSKRKYDLSWRGEIALALVYTGAFLAWRGTYGVVPLLMAAGVAGCVTYLAWMLWRLLFEKNLRLHNFQLRLRGKLRPAGVVFAILAGATVLATVQAGLTRVQATRAGFVDNLVQVPAEVVFVADRPPLPPEQLDLARRALDLYTSGSSFREGGLGLATTPVHEVRRAWLYSVLGDFDKTIGIIRALMDRGEVNPDLALSLASIHDARSDPGAAIDDLRRALGITPRMTQVRFELARRLARAGRFHEAVALLDEGVSSRPWDALQRIEFAQLLMAAGDAPRAEEQARAAIDLRERERHAASQLSAPRAWRVLAETQIRQNKVDDALASLDRVIELAPDDPEAPTTAARILVQNRRMAEAPAYLDKAEAARDRLIQQQRQQR